MTNSGISIIILTLNGERQIEKLLESFFDTNTYYPVEFIVVDHGSTDRTFEVISRYATRAFIRLIKRKQNYSFAVSCAHGASKARYPYLLFMNNDIDYKDDTLPKAMAFVEGDKTIQALGLDLNEQSKPIPKNNTNNYVHVTSSECLRFFIDYEDLTGGPESDRPKSNLRPKVFFNGLMVRSDYQKQLFDLRYFEKLAEKSSELEQWTSSALYLRALFKFHGNHLPVKTLLQISSKLFKLDDFTFAARVLAAAKTKKQDQHVLRLEKMQYYYHAYSNWLMENMADEYEWYKADGLGKRPSLHKLVRLCKEFVEPSGENRPTDLQQFIQASLLLAEDMRDKNDHIRADGVLKEALHYISSELSEDMISSVVESINTVRKCGEDALEDENSRVQDILRSTPLKTLSVHQWLFFNDVLNWCGMLRCGMTARKCALEQARKQGDAYPAHEKKQLIAAQAAIEQSDFFAAEEYIDKFKASKGDPRTVSELKAYLRLNQGDFKGFRRHFGYPHTEADRRFQEYIRGKSIAIVGPAPTGESNGEEIDSFDVVVRFNYRNLGAHPEPKKYGTRTHVSLYNAHGFRHLIATNSLKILDELDFCLIRRPRYDFDVLQVEKKRIRQIHEPKHAFYKSMNAVPAIVYDMLLQGASKIKVFNTNFYMTKQHHSVQYSYRDETRLNALPLRKIQPVMANHDMVSQILFMQKLKNISTVEFDLTCNNVINSNKHSYISSIEKNALPKISLKNKIKKKNQNKYCQELDQSLKYIVEELQKYEKHMRKIDNESKCNNTQYKKEKNLPEMNNEYQLLKKQVEAIQEELR